VTLTIDGTALDNIPFGWEVLGDTEISSSVSNALIDAQASGRDGSIARLRAPRSAPIIPVVMETPKANLSLLRMLLRSGKILGDTDTPGRFAVMECAQIADTMIYAANGPDVPELHEVRAMLKLPEIYWYDDTVTTSAAVSIVGSAGTTRYATVFPGATGPNRKSLVRLKGPTISIIVTDVVSQTYFTYSPNLPASSYLRFDAETGKAWVTNTDTWFGGTEVTEFVRTGRGPYPLELAPAIVAGVATTTLAITGTASTGATIEVRGQARHDR